MVIQNFTDSDRTEREGTSDLHHCRKAQPIQNMTVLIEMFLNVEFREVYGSRESQYGGDSEDKDSRCKSTALVLSMNLFSPHQLHWPGSTRSLGENKKQISRVHYSFSPSDNTDIYRKFPRFYSIALTLQEAGDYCKYATFSSIMFIIQQVVCIRLYSYSSQP